EWDGCEAQALPELALVERWIALEHDRDGLSLAVLHQQRFEEGARRQIERSLELLDRRRPGRRDLAPRCRGLLGRIVDTTNRAFEIGAVIAIRADRDRVLADI